MRPALPLLVLCLVGCASTPLDRAVRAANDAHAHVVEVGTLEEGCADAYKRAKTKDDVATADAWCTPVRDAWVRYQAAWRALAAAIAATKVSGDDYSDAIEARQIDLNFAASKLGYALAQRGAP